MNDWRDCLLGDVITLKRGYDLPERQRIPGVVPVVSSAGISGYHNVAKVKAPGVVTGRYGTLGEVFYLSEDYWPHNTALYVQDFKDNNPRFISYFLASMGLAFRNAAGAVPGVNRNHLHQIPVRVPSVKTQEKISSILAAYDDLIENNTRRIQILEQIAHDLYQEWFVYFRFPGYEDTEFGDSELGSIPQGWEVRLIDDLCTYSRGKSYSSSELVSEGGLPFLNLKCIERDGGFRYDGLKRFQGKYKESQAASAGDVIIAITDMTQERRIVARAARVPETGAELYVFSMDLVKINPKHKIPNDYLYSLFRYSSFADHVKQAANGANVLHLLPDHILAYKFVRPTNEVIQQFAERVKSLYQLRDSFQVRNENLRQVRDLLLPRLVSGELDVTKLKTQDEELETMEA